jgi:hypothetical protein
VAAPGSQTMTAGSSSNCIAGFLPSCRFSDHPARDARALAQGRLSLLLALEVAPTGRATADRHGVARIDPADKRRKSDLGRATASTENCSSSGLKSRSRASPSTWSNGGATQPGMAVRLPVWVLCHEHRRSTRRGATVLEMKEGPSGSAIRSLIPSHRERLWSKATVVSVAETSGQ